MTHHETHSPMPHTPHEGHQHRHGPDCGHTGIKHDGHVDYVHDGHLHNTASENVMEHRLDVNDRNPAGCTPEHRCNGHVAEHEHGRDCGHEAVPHGDHMDYLVDDHLHHPHGDHCDDHGQVTIA